ncbi:MAG TPA: ABC transporter ATP-binding protein [Blastocatellia bacterium]|nr:ABC transporter ATP-binding protein [Blastocatellia bacterium]
MKENGDKPAVQIKGLRKSFGRQTVLDGIDLEVPQGETLTVLGRSGTGKSVLLKLIIGLQQPDAGSIEIFGQEVIGLPVAELNQIRKRIGFLFQQAALYDSLTVAENVAFPLRRHTKMNDDEINDRVRELLARVGMEKDVQKMPADISGGMKKRVGLARALALDPEVMLLDEPTAGLDPITTEEIDELIQGLNQERGITSIVVTHDLLSVRRLADRIVMLKEGHIVAEGGLDELRRSRDPFVAEFMHAGSQE